MKYLKKNKMKQTAVEWLVEELTKQNMFMDLFKEEIEQAKEMEKEQMVDAWNSAYGGDSHHDGKDYFNKTYKSE